MKRRKQQISKAIKLCKYQVRVGLDVTDNCICVVATLWGNGFCRVLKNIIIYKRGD